MSDLSHSFDLLFRSHMGITPGERIVVFSDMIREDEPLPPDERERRGLLLQVARDCASFAAETYGNCSFVSFPATSASGAEPPRVLWEETLGRRIVDELSSAGILLRLLDKSASSADLETARETVRRFSGDVARVVIALSNNSTSHTSYRRLSCHGGSRFASLPHFDPAMFSGSMCADPAALAERTERVARIVNRGAAIEVTTPLGTSLFLDKRGRCAEGDDGNLTKPGSFGNLPAGEVYLAPVEGSASGRMVVTHAPTRKLRSPLTFIIDRGNVVEIQGDDPYRELLEEKFAQSPLNRNIAELGIGTNDRASRADNVLEAEKILGTVHVALGDNSGFGGTVSTPFHEDYVLFSPTLTIIDDGGNRIPLLAEGKLLA